MNARPQFELVKFAPGHLDRHGDELLFDGTFMLDGHRLAPDFAFTAYYGERIAGMACLTPVGEAWAWCGVAPSRSLTLNGWSQAIPALHRVIWNAHANGIRRIDTFVVATFTQGHRLVNRLGFQFRGDHTGFDGTTAVNMLYTHVSPRLVETERQRAARLAWHQALLDQHAPDALLARHLR